MEEHCGFTESRTAQPPLTRWNVQHPPITLLPFSYCQETNEERSLSSWKDRLVQLSNLASIICAIDCTVLPVMTVLLSFLGLAEQPHQWEWLHMAGHGVAMYFVLPVGGLTTALNFVEHKNASLTVPALVGLLFIYLANHHASHTDDGAFLHWVQVHTGTAHRLTSILGCSMLLLSNFRAQRLKGACRDKKCKHNIL